MPFGVPVDLLGFLVRRVGPAEAAILLELQLIRSGPLVLRRRIISSLTLRAG